MGEGERNWTEEVEGESRPVMQALWRSGGALLMNFDDVGELPWTTKCW